MSKKPVTKRAPRTRKVKKDEVIAPVDIGNVDTNGIAPQRIVIRNAITMECENWEIWKILDETTRQTLARRIERGCFEVTITECEIAGIERQFTEKKFVERYSAISSRVINNLSANGSVKSDFLIKKVINNEVDPHNVARMNSIELCPMASESERKMIEIRQNQKAVTKVSRAHTCKKCHKNETIPQEVQSRAADESSTSCILCVHCGHNWRF